MKKFQNGRSMIEMLGVLAIIGVLSIGGLAGYTMAMNRHRANQILDYVSRCAIAAQTKGDGYKIEESNCGALLPIENAPNGLGGAAGNTDGVGTKFLVKSSSEDKQYFVIVTPKIASKDIRTALLNRDNVNVKIRQGVGGVDGSIDGLSTTVTDVDGGVEVSFQFQK